MAESRDELLVSAWGLIANAGGGDWSTQSEEWQSAAKTWRDRFNAYLCDKSRVGEPRRVTISYRDFLARTIGKLNEVAHG